ncbi:MAG: hypothetical protein GQ564_20365 [Bacteroidales bacterium]|nr:hypothetical protein [Bacteroidales bacterium]
MKQVYELDVYTLSEKLSDGMKDIYPLIEKGFILIPEVHLKKQNPC